MISGGHSFVDVVGLDSSFCRQMDKEAVSYMLELQDSTGKVIDAVKQGFNKIPRGKEDFSMPLGLLEKHTIRARFGLPVGEYFFMMSGRWFCFW